jgi:hypothetical protein
MLKFEPSEDNDRELISAFYEVTFANDLYIDIFTTLFYHLKHNRIVPLSIPVEFKQRHHRLLLILILSGDHSMSKRLRAGMSARMKVAMPPPWSVRSKNE